MILELEKAPIISSVAVFGKIVLAKTRKVFFLFESNQFIFHFTNFYKKKKKFKLLTYMYIVHIM